jgi:hypothetical protein
MNRNPAVSAIYAQTVPFQITFPSQNQRLSLFKSQLVMALSMSQKLRTIYAVEGDNKTQLVMVPGDARVGGFVELIRAKCGQPELRSVWLQSLEVCFSMISNVSSSDKPPSMDWYNGLVPTCSDVVRSPTAPADYSEIDVSALAALIRDDRDICPITGKPMIDDPDALDFI